MRHERSERKREEELQQRIRKREPSPEPDPSGERWFRMVRRRAIKERLQNNYEIPKIGSQIIYKNVEYKILTCDGLYATLVPVTDETYFADIRVNELIKYLKSK